MHELMADVHGNRVALLNGKIRVYCYVNFGVEPMPYPSDPDLGGVHHSWRMVNGMSDFICYARVDSIEKTDKYSLPGGKKIMVPRKTAVLAAKHDASGAFEIAGGWIAMELAGGRMFSRLVEGTYPAYENVIPKENPIKVSFQGAELLKILEGALPLCRNDAVKITVNGRLEVATSNPDLGDYNWRMPCQSQGKGDEEITVGFNAKYVIDAVKSFTTKENDEVTLELPEKPLAPCILNGKAVIMPMRI